MLSSVTPLIIISIVLVFAVLWITSFDYQCGNCGEKFSLPASAIFALHWMGRRFVRCPECGERTWATPVPKEK